MRQLVTKRHLKNLVVSMIRIVVELGIKIGYIKKSRDACGAESPER